MQVYVAHASCYAYHTELYQPIQELELTKVRFVLPHLASLQANHSRQAIANSALVLAEVSYPSTGLGIELGWSDSLNKPIYCLYRAGTNFSTSLSLITDRLYAYRTRHELKEIISLIIRNV